MRVQLQCLVCEQNFGAAEKISYGADLLDDGTAKIVCRHGHKVINTILSEKHELLANIAVSAIIDGYYREAIASFTSSLERFYEFYLEIVFLSKNMDDA